MPCYQMLFLQCTGLKHRHTWTLPSLTRLRSGGLYVLIHTESCHGERALPLSASFVVSKLHHNHEVDTIISHLTARKFEVQRSEVTAHGDKEMVRSSFNDKAMCLRNLSCCCFCGPSLWRGASFCLLFSAFLQSTKSGQVRAQWPERG